MKFYASELISLSVEKMNSIVEDIIDLLKTSQIYHRHTEVFL